jgi:flagellar protein FliS
MYARSYQQVQNETATRERQLVLLFEAAQRHMQAGAAAYERGQSAQAGQSVGKASDIVMELWGSLDRARAPELCDRLEAVYEFVSFKLTQALTGRDPKHLEGALRAFAPLVDAFRQAVAKAEAAP